MSLEKISRPGMTTTLYEYTIKTPYQSSSNSKITFTLEGSELKLHSHTLEPRMRCSPSFNRLRLAFIDSKSPFEPSDRYTHNALDPLTGKPIRVCFNATYTQEDARARFGRRILRLRPHWYASQHLVKEALAFTSYCLVAQREDGQYMLIG